VHYKVQFYIRKNPEKNHEWKERRVEDGGSTCTAYIPTPPEAAVMSRFFCVLLSQTSSIAVEPATPSEAPSIAETSSGLFTVVLIGAIAYSANDPPWKPS
jgi:predicted solute-binding protein